MLLAFFNPKLVLDNIPPAIPSVTFPTETCMTEDETSDATLRISSASCTAVFDNSYFSADSL